MHRRCKIFANTLFVMSFLFIPMSPALLVAREAASSVQAVKAEGVVKQDGILTLDQCVQNALQEHPAIRAATGTRNATQSRIGQARSGYYPQLNAIGGYRYSRYALVGLPTSTFFGRSSAAINHQEQYSAGATLTQNIFNFGKTWKQVTIQQLNTSAAEDDLRDVRGQVVFNVKQAYYSLLQSGKNRDVLLETVKLFEQHLEQARGSFEIGVKSKFDVTKAEVDLGNARLNLISAENAFRIARVTLNNAMGSPDAPEYAIEDTLSFKKNPITLEEARQKAFDNRPDLSSLSVRREASEESISLARKEYMPILSGNATYTRIGENYPPERDEWSAGITLTFPLFSGMLTKYQVREARENLYVLRANEETLRQAILLDVQQAYLNLQEAEERVEVAELTVRQAEENFEIAKGRYDAGVGSPIEETDALVALSNAKTNHIAALSDYKVSEAALIRAMGE